MGKHWKPREREIYSYDIFELEFEDLPDYTNDFEPAFRKPKYTGPVDVPVSAPVTIGLSTSARVDKPEPVVEPPVVLSELESLPPPVGPPFDHKVADDDVELRASDGILFWYSLTLLSMHSSFFSRLAYDTAVSHKSKPISIPATSTILETFLCLITPGCPEPASLSLDVEPGVWCWTIKQLLHFAELCYIPTLPLRISGHFEAKGDVWVLYALAAAQSDKQLAIQLSRQTCTLDLATITPHAYHLLESLAPTYLSRLQILHQARKIAWDQCKKAIRKKEPMPNGINDFTKRCLKNGCVGITVSGGDFKCLRNMAATAAIHAMGERGKDEDVMYLAINGVVHCKSCFRRLTSAFGSAIRNTIGSAPTTISNQVSLPCTFHFNQKIHKNKTRGQNTQGLHFQSVQYAITPLAVHFGRTWPI